MDRQDNYFKFIRVFIEKNLLQYLFGVFGDFDI